MVNEAGRRLGRVQFLSGNSLKIIACISMFIDHLSKIFIAAIMSNVLFPMTQNGQMSYEKFYAINDFVKFKLYAIGTIAFPIFCFLLVEGFTHTSNKKRYIGSMLIFALISEIPFDIGFFSDFSKEQGTFPFYFEYQNVFFTLCLGLLCLFILEKLPQLAQDKVKKENIKALMLQACAIGIVAVAAEFLKCDYGSEGIIFIVGFYLLRKNRILQVLGFVALYMATTGNQPTICIVIAALLLLLYNGKRGKLKLKYFFYWFYPVHILLLYTMKVLLV